MMHGESDVTARQLLSKLTALKNACEAQGEPLAKMWSELFIRIAQSAFDTARKVHATIGMYDLPLDKLKVEEFSKQIDLLSSCCGVAGDAKE